MQESHFSTSLDHVQQLKMTLNEIIINIFDRKYIQFWHVWNMIFFTKLTDCFVFCFFLPKLEPLDWMLNIPNRNKEKKYWLTNKEHLEIFSNFKRRLWNFSHSEIFRFFLRAKLNFFRMGSFYNDSENLKTGLF